METEELKITSVEFTASATDGTITVNVRNTGTTDVVIISGTVNDAPGTMDDDITVSAGSPQEIALTKVDFTEGTAYNVEILSSKGNKFSYVGTATTDSQIP